ncbi:nuclease-related domain-containing protein [Alteribacillus sp. HJP-4]|uniref:nuclease-related domain-containing protein n=1 Tax=Alteribacillus sp. HJP-4 TaxID=2775394 RepID=UPI0035CD1009
MIVKPRTTPLYLQQLQALERRLPSPHPKRQMVENTMARWSAGFKGEQSLDYPLTFLPKDKFLILHDVRLHDGTHYFQMDTLILSEHFLVILEVKSISGTLIFNTDFNQLIRYDGEKEEAFSDPLIQVRRHQAQLTLWLQQVGLSIPVEGFVVMGNYRTVLKKTPDSLETFENVIQGHVASEKVLDLLKLYPTTTVTQSQLKALSKKLMHQHKEGKRDILKQFSISPDEIIRGVYCPDCPASVMQRKHGSWNCPACQKHWKKAHMEALSDFSLLFSHTISNKQAREFLKIPSRDAVKRLLQSIKVSQSGEYSRRRYKLPFR